MGLIQGNEPVLKAIEVLEARMDALETEMRERFDALRIVIVIQTVAIVAVVAGAPPMRQGRSHRVRPGRGGGVQNPKGRPA